MRGEGQQEEPLDIKLKLSGVTSGIESDIPNVFTRDEKRALFVVAHSSIEHLGMMHLMGLARDEGWERAIVLVRNHDFTEFFHTIKDYKPRIVLGSTYTGNQKQLSEAFKQVGRDHPDIRRAIGGPHATYFPDEMLDCAENIVMSEGFRSLRKILRNEVGPGILELEKTERFPLPDRETLYKYSPAHRRSKIKSIILMTGCPERCDYCYNSTDRSVILVPRDKLAKPLGVSLPVISCQERHGMGERLFPLNIRSVDDIIREVEALREVDEGATDELYIQYDISFLDAKAGGQSEQFAERIVQFDLGLNAQTRCEYLTVKKEGDKRLDIMQKAGVHTLTMAIESEDSTIRDETLSRHHPQEDMFEGAKKITDRGIRIRTEQITFLPSGTTSKETPMNEELDFRLLDLNRAIAEHTGREHMSWYSTLVYYPRANITERTGRPHGFWRFDKNDIDDSFFKRSGSHALREWVGPEIGTLKKEIVRLTRLHHPIPDELARKYSSLCEQLRNDESAWLPPAELDLYRDRNAEFRNHGTYFGFIPKAGELARSYILSPEQYTLGRLVRETKRHLMAIANQGDRKAGEILERVPHIQQALESLNGTFQGANAERIREDLKPLILYFAVLPKGELAVQRAAKYALFRNGGKLDSYELSTATRHHLYDNFLYRTGEDETYSGNIPLQPTPIPIKEERYPAKV